MPKQTRHVTAYSGVYFVELADNDKSFFIRYKKNGRSFEERAGRSSKGWKVFLEGTDSQPPVSRRHLKQVRHALAKR